MYIDLDNKFYHGFAYEIQQAALQLPCTETNRYDASERFLVKYPPDSSFCERCRPATKMRKHLQEFPWVSDMYPPIGSLQLPPTERQWKVQV